MIFEGKKKLRALLYPTKHLYTSRASIGFRGNDTDRILNRILPEALCLSPPHETAAKHVCEGLAVNFAGKLDAGVQWPRHVEEHKPQPFHCMTPAVGADPIANLQG